MTASTCATARPMRRGWTLPSKLRGPVAASAAQSARAVWTRAAMGADWKEEMVSLAKSAQPMARMRRRDAAPAHGAAAPAAQPQPLQPVVAAFVVRDNLRQRRSIERAYIEAVLRARERVDLVTPYFYPGRRFRRALFRAAQRGARVRLLLQGKIDYRFAALAAQVQYDELRRHGIQIYEYTPAFLHAKVALVDGEWATVGSSNIDPLSLLLNLEANVIVQRRRLHARAVAALRRRHCRVARGHRRVARRRLAPGGAARLRGLVRQLVLAHGGHHRPLLISAETRCSVVRARPERNP